jgi:hypothetical protein
MASPCETVPVHHRGGCKAHGAALSELYVCIAQAVMESDEMQKWGPEMQKNGLGRNAVHTAESGKMFLF